MLRAYIEVSIRDRNGVLLCKGRVRARSFINNMLKILEGFLNSVGGAAVGYMDSVTSVNVVDFSGSTVAFRTERYLNVTNTCTGGTFAGTAAGDNDDSYGIIVGSGTTGVALDGYALAAKISHGTGSGQLDYGSSSTEDLGLDTGVSPPVYRFRILRTFTNLSGASININEVGLGAKNYWKSYGGQDYGRTCLIMRDVLPSTYAVPNGGTATVAITVEVEVG
jgi:hypothetical protein